ncbi:lipase family protein [Parafrankia sp. EUN1f]|uniref:lipase family protein n=1 Tax=Parafrankia sp. EUN1f TaxID=102897 RepID=UPI0001C43939|nr:lipase family protein [Parafrankia sp. EUN1f]EFC86153.1 secretory lipase [Parafrankia sp. EUN1f]
MTRPRIRLLCLTLGAAALTTPLTACTARSTSATALRPTAPTVASATAPTRTSKTTNQPRATGTATSAASYQLSGYGLKDLTVNGRAGSEDLADLPAGKPGELVSTAPVTAPDGLRAWRMLYHSTGPDGEDRLVTGLVVAPAAGTPVPPGGRQLVAFGHGTTGINDSCAPSRADSPLSTVGGTLQLARDGNVLAITDYTGLGGPGEHPIYVADVEGKAVLDAARAARSLTAAQVGRDVVLWGYSQGGQAVLAAGGLATAYAPDLPVRGVAATAPLADLRTSLRELLATPGGVGYLLLAVLGVTVADPAVNPAGLLTATGRRLSALAHNRCAIDLLQASTGESVTSVFTSDPLRTEPFAGALERQWQQLEKPGPPKLVLQGDLDTVIRQPTTDNVVRALCAAGGPVEYRRYQLADHLTVVNASMRDLSAWINARFATDDTAAPDSCSQL